MNLDPVYCVFVCANGFYIYILERHELILISLRVFAILDLVPRIFGRFPFAVADVGLHFLSLVLAHFILMAYISCMV